MNINDLDKIKVPKNFDERINKIYKKNSKPHYIRNVIAASFLIFLSGFAVPGYTRDMPIYSNIFTMLGMEKYQDSSELILMTKKDKGIKITLSDVILSNNVLSYTYIIETDKDIDLGKNVSTFMGIDHISWLKYGITGLGGSSHVEQKSPTTYVGVDEQTLTFNGETPEQMNLIIKADRIESFNKEYQKNIEIKGNWTFPVKVTKLAANVIKPKDVFEKDGVFAKVNNISVDSSVTNIQVDTWNKLGLVNYVYDVQNVKLTDENGNSYDVKGGGISSDDKSSKSYFQTKVLEKGMKYKFQFDLIMVEYMGFNENNIKEKIQGYGTEAYNNAKKKIQVEIPFEY